MKYNPPLGEIKNKGYWTVDDVEYDVKVNAILAAQELNLSVPDVKYHYNDKWWHPYRWDIEPTQSLEELYIERAKQLRDRYDTLILRFSGGADSTNVLRTFVDNGIKLDVVSINMWYQEGSDPWTEPSNIEKRDIAIPLAEKLKAQGADFELVINNFTQASALLGNDPDWIFRIDAPRFNCVDICYHQASTTLEYEKWNNPSTCIITGVDKPFISYDPAHNLWYSQIPDCMHSVLNQSSQMIQEPFYWTADLPEIIIKQSHVLKNYYKNNIDKMSNMGSKYQVDHKTLTKKRQVIPLIYAEYYDFLEIGTEDLPYYDMSVAAENFKNGKIGAPRGYGFDFNIEKSPYYQSWVDGINLADQLINREFKFEDSIWTAGLEWCKTKKQWLGR
jgi:hypothetical protein